MVGRRQRHALPFVALILAVTTATVLVNQFVLQAEWRQVDHQTTGLPATRLADMGPPPGPLVSTWQRAIPVERSGLPPYDQVAHAVVQGRLVVVSGRGLDVRDARTGAARWHYRRSGWTLLGWAATRSHLVAYLQRAGDPDDRLVLGFDAVSGRLLWRAAGEAPPETERLSLRWPAGSDVVLTTAGDSRSVRGRSAATGKRVWTATLPRGCEPPRVAANGSGGSETLAVLTLRCGAHGRVLAVDPRTGRVRWSKTLESAEPPAVAVDGNVTITYDGSSLRVFDGHGDEITARTGEDLCGSMCLAVVSADRLILVHGQGTDEEPTARGVHDRMEAIELASGRTVWQRDVPAYSALTVGGDRLYALRRRLSDNLLPAGFDIIDPGDGTTTTVPASFVIGPRVEGVRPWLAAAGGLLFVAVPQAVPRLGTEDPDGLRSAGAARLIAVRGGSAGRGPEEFGGVARAAWPDACRLLRGQDLAAVRPDGYSTKPEYADVGGVRLPRPVSCRYEPRDDKGQGATALTVTVEWVADSRESATELFAAWRATEPLSRQLLDINDEAYELGTSGTIAVRIDRCIFAVNAYQNPGAATRLARAAAARLAQAGPRPSNGR